MPASELAPSAPPLPPQPPPPPPPPRDFHALSERAALKDFLAAPISAGGRVLGSLTVASTRRGAFDGWAWEPTVTMAATGLLPHLLNPQVGPNGSGGGPGARWGWKGSAWWSSRVS
jgi:hypothetical protein